MTTKSTLVIKSSMAWCAEALVVLRIMVVPRQVGPLILAAWIVQSALGAVFWNASPSLNSRMKSQVLSVQSLPLRIGASDREAVRLVRFSMSFLKPNVGQLCGDSIGTQVRTVFANTLRNATSQEPKRFMTRMALQQRFISSSDQDALENHELIHG